MTQDEPQPWELSNVPYDSLERYGLFRPVAATGWGLPSDIWIDEGRLFYSFSRPHSRLDIKKCGPNMLERFVRLHGQPDDVVLSFARGWGPLQICSHGLPAAHQGGVTQLPDYTPGKCVPEWRRDGTRVVYSEPIAAWHSYSREALAMLNVAASLRGGVVKASKVDFASLGCWLDVVRAEMGRTDEIGTPDLFDRAARLPSRMRLAIEGLNRWIYLGGVRPSVEWLTKGSPSIQFFTPGLFGALALQLMLAVSGSDGWAMCSGCGRPFSPSKVPAGRRRRYCEDCRKAGVDRRHASRDYRARRRAEKKSGDSVTQK